MKAEAKLKEMGLKLPAAATPVYQSLVNLKEKNGKKLFFERIPADMPERGFK